MYKGTLGVGSLAIAGMLSALWQDVSVWIALVIALVPFVVFVFVHPGELPSRFVVVAQTAASIWYPLVAVGLFVALAGATKPLPRGWPLYGVLAAIGALPCGIVLYRWARGFGGILTHRRWLRVPILLGGILTPPGARVAEITPANRGQPPRECAADFSGCPFARLLIYFFIAPAIRPA